MLSRVHFCARSNDHAGKFSDVRGCKFFSRLHEIEIEKSGESALDSRYHEY